MAGDGPQENFEGKKKGLGDSGRGTTHMTHEKKPPRLERKGGFQKGSNTGTEAIKRVGRARRS